MHSPEHAAGLIELSLDELRNPEAEKKSVAQVDFVRRLHTWDQRAELFEKWLSEIDGQ